MSTALPWNVSPPSRKAADCALAGPGRCFPFWQEVLACYVVNTNSEDTSGKSKCMPVLEDYYECLHHKKEVSRGQRTRCSSQGARANVGGVTQAARTMAVQTAYRKAELSRGREDAPTAGQIRNLGLLSKEEDTKKVLGASS